MGAAGPREAHGGLRLPPDRAPIRPRGDQAARGLARAQRPPGRAGGRKGRGGRPHRAHRLQDRLQAARPRAHDRPGRPARGRRGDGGAALRRALGRAGRGPPPRAAAPAARCRRPRPRAGADATGDPRPPAPRRAGRALARADPGHLRRVPERPLLEDALERQALCAAPRGAVRRRRLLPGVPDAGRARGAHAGHGGRARQDVPARHGRGPQGHRAREAPPRAGGRAGLVPRLRALPRRQAERVLARDCLSGGFLHGPDGLRSGASRSSSRHVRAREDGRKALRRG